MHGMGHGKCSWMRKIYNFSMTFKIIFHIYIYMCGIHFGISEMKCIIALILFCSVYLMLVHVSRYQNYRIALPGLCCFRRNIKKQKQKMHWMPVRHFPYSWHFGEITISNVAIMPNIWMREFCELQFIFNWLSYGALNIFTMTFHIYFVKRVDYLSCFWPIGLRFFKTKKKSLMILMFFVLQSPEIKFYPTKMPTK